uniref:Uncharacterized protein n=1 Tax=Glossina pallidipes TaxID=7398 RepID=A0A1B0AHH4_GLOPL
MSAYYCRLKDLMEKKTSPSSRRVQLGLQLLCLRYVSANVLNGLWLMAYAAMCSVDLIGITKTFFPYETANTRIKYEVLEDLSPFNPLQVFEFFTSVKKQIHLIPSINEDKP